MSRYRWVAGIAPGSQPVCLERCKESRQLLAFPLQLQQQICCFSYLRGNMWPSCLHISCALTRGCFSSLKLLQEEIHLEESALQLLAQYSPFITAHIATSLAEGGWHFVMGHTMCRSLNVCWRRRPPGPASCMVTAVWRTNFGNSSASPAVQRQSLISWLILRLVQDTPGMLTKNRKWALQKHGALGYLGAEGKPGTGLFWKGMWRCGDTLKATPTFPPRCCAGDALHSTQLQKNTAPGQQMEHAQLG